VVGISEPTRDARGARDANETYAEQVAQAQAAVDQAVRDANAQAEQAAAWFNGNFPADAAAHSPGRGQAPNV
jgi:hypothetical protein